MNTAEILRAAAGRVRQGWTQRGGIKRGKVCAYGGVASVVTCGRFDVTPSEALREPEHLSIVTAMVYVCRAIGARLLFSGYPDNQAVYDWNDAHGQTAENVAAGLEYAALLWEQEQALGVDGGQVEAVPVCTTK